MDRVNKNLITRDKLQSLNLNINVDELDDAKLASINNKVHEIGSWYDQDETLYIDEPIPMFEDIVLNALSLLGIPYGVQDEPKESHLLVNIQKMNDYVRDIANKVNLVGEIVEQMLFSPTQEQDDKYQYNVYDSWDYVYHLLRDEISELAIMLGVSLST